MIVRDVLKAIIARCSDYPTIIVHDIGKTVRFLMLIAKQQYRTDPSMVILTGMALTNNS
jgi:hypothetical protein